MKTNPTQFPEAQARPTRQSLFWCSLCCLLALALAGCKPEPKATPETNPVGTYALVSVDGKNVPSTVQHEGHAVAIKSGKFLINPDGTCSSTVVFSVASGGDISREVKATYTRQGPTLTMQWEGAGTTTGTVEGDTFTMNNEGMILLYQKQGQFHG